MAKESLWSETWPLIKALALVGMTQAYVGEITVVRKSLPNTSRLLRSAGQRVSPTTSQSQGPSMLPTLQQTGDILFVDKLSPRWRPIQRDEIVVAASPHKLGEAVCKRVLALVSPSHTARDTDFNLHSAAPVVVLHRRATLSQLVGPACECG